MALPAKIVDMAATRLGILGEGERLESVVKDDLDESYNEVHAQLLAKNVAVWDLTEDVPDEFTPHVVALVAFNRVDEYSVPNDKYQRILAGEQRALLEIKELKNSDTYITPTPDYF